MEEVIRYLRELLGLENAAVIAVGAEAVLVKGDISGEAVIVKYRLEKSYRHPLLDAHLRMGRTNLEARLLAKAGMLGINVPHVIYIDAQRGILVTSFIRGRRLKEVLDEGADGAMVSELLRQAGFIVAKLHTNGIIHGDLTTSNFIVCDGELWLIDFGLGFFSQRDEDRGTDIHLFYRVLESTHPLIAQQLLKYFLEGYRVAAGEEFTKRVLDRVYDIRLRGRYVSIRRKSL
ncbi:Kae1-associated kinase Bud32 [Infirmifilum lucidum]|uniref:non-specific serine/threonine protein kinase n=1 Tax=Infirmifilum lucidum TaxID=2776706 RepID=A0A7L9FGX6_9CREN|nr:Kae1-associated kinase Bud32 [Infirmifilum lucidum]QOJ78176.1 Kae1-associated kinase Bud32 [Infirmifilum lucidum]